jgi:hypothetical protein
MPFIDFYKLQKNALHAGTVLLCTTFVQATFAQTQDTVANPQAQVPSVSYRSVFKETSLGVEKDTIDWRKANDEVGRFTRGHIDILKWEEQQTQMGTPPMQKPMAEPTAMPKPDMVAPTTSTMDATKPIAAPAHKH